ncbi:MAG: Hint domain-containing protein [Planktomarina sp.]
MAVYNLSVILRENTTATSSTDFRNGDWELLAPGYSTITISDDDNFGLGDNSAATETGAIATVTHIDGVAISPSHPLASGIYAKFVRVDDGDGDTDDLADVVVLGGTGAVNQSDAMVAYPGSNWSMSVGDTYDATAGKTPSDHGDRSWSIEAMTGGLVTPPCFTPGGLVLTASGRVPVETLRAGDQIVTRDGGLQTVEWVYGTPLSRSWFAANPTLCPIFITRGALGHNVPERDIMVSPGHLVLVRDGNRETLVPARQLRNRDGIYQVKPMNTGYIHLLFDQHHVIDVDGMWSESFQPSIRSVAGIGADARHELFKIFPQLAVEDGYAQFDAARPVLYRSAARELVTKLNTTQLQ